MIQAVGDISAEHQELVKKVFLKHDLNIEFTGVDRLADIKTISFMKNQQRF